MKNEEAFELALVHFKQFYLNSNEYRFLIDLKTLNTIYSNIYYDIWNEEKQILTQGKGSVNLHDFIADHPHKEHLLEVYKKIVVQKLATTKLGINFFRKKDFVVMYFYYSPLINPTTQDVIAIDVISTKLNFPIAFFKLPNLISKISAPHISFSDFGKRLESYDELINNYEHEIIFLMFYFDTYEDIASVISLKYGREVKGNTVAKYVRKYLYPKFNVISHKDLKNAAVSHGYHKKIPLSLMSSMIVDLSEL